MVDYPAAKIANPALPMIELTAKEAKKNNKKKQEGRAVGLISFVATPAGLERPQALVRDRVASFGASTAACNLSVIHKLCKR